MGFKKKISANSIFQYRYMIIDDRGITYAESVITTRKRRFSYLDIEYVFVSPTNEITFQVGEESFSLPYKPYDKKHQAFLEGLKQRVWATMPASPNFQAGV